MRRFGSAVSLIYIFVNMLFLSGGFYPPRYSVGFDKIIHYVHGVVFFKFPLLINNAVLTTLLDFFVITFIVLQCSFVNAKNDEKFYLRCFFKPKGL